MRKIALLFSAALGLALIGPGAAFAITSPPTNISKPTIAGVAQVGQTMTVTDRGNWIAPAGTSMNDMGFFWQDCDPAGGGLWQTCKDIPGSAADSYTLQSSDVGYAVRVYETLTSSWGSGVATSLLSATVVPAPAATKPVVKTAPAISGKAKRGSKLTLSAGSFRGTAPITFSYQWKRCAAKLVGGKPAGCKAIAGARKMTRTLTKSDVGHRIVALVTAKNTVGAASVSTRATGVVSK